MVYDKPITAKQLCYLQIFEKFYKCIGIDMLKMEFMKVITPEQLEQVVDSLLNNYDLPWTDKNTIFS